MWQQFSFGGRKFIAVAREMSPFSKSYFILDSHGNSYGAWQDIEHFRTKQRQGSDMAEPIGKGELTVRTS